MERAILSSFNHQFIDHKYYLDLRLAILTPPQYLKVYFMDKHQYS